MRRASVVLLCLFASHLGCSGDKGDSAGTVVGGDADADADADSDTDADADADADADMGEAVVVISGGVHLTTGGTTALTATTVNGEDDSYTWASSDPTLATVDGSGVVTGVFSGELTVTATGVDSGAAGTVGLVVSDELPQADAWAASGHADRSSDSFNHWNEDGAVSASCAKCHSKPGFLDYLGADGSAAGTVEADAPLGTVVDCATCHDPAAQALDHVTFPSGAEVENLGGEARCMTCHQGRSHGGTVDEKIEELGLTETPDTSSAELGFTNIHYYPAAATLYAAEAGGGYEYADKVYDWRFRHVSDIDTCTDCHDAHSLEVKVDTCGECHTGVSTAEDLPGIRMMASFASDYDGDGNTTEGIRHEIRGLADLLLATLQTYATDQGLAAICYSSSAYPYWFTDTDADGSCDDTEASYANAYAAWTPRLLKGAYNYQVATKDPGNFAHNAKYTIQLLHDSLTDVNSALAAPADLSAVDREDPGHFNGAGEAARHWDEDETVSSSCSQCHGGAEGLHFYLDYGVGISDLAPDNGLECETCHDQMPDYSLVTVDSITFPSGIELEDPGNPSNLCGTCHSGRESKATVDSQIASGSYRFKNVHYLPAAGTLAGTDAQVGYEYDGYTYAPAWSNHSGGSDCTDCHAADHTDHTFQADDNLAYCQVCHTGADELGDIRNVHDEDVDGDANAAETLKDELDGLAALLYAQIQQKGQEDGAPICYDAHAYPYWFVDTDSSGGACNGSEASYSNSYAAWTPALMRATFNYQMAQKDPGAWAHNFAYMAQLLIDANEDLGGDVSALNRP